jgi:hypothetical protein
MKAKVDERETNSTMKNIRGLYRGISDFKKGYQPRTNVVKDEKGGLVTDSHSILAGKLIGGHQCGLTQQVVYSAFGQILDEKYEYNEAVHQLFIDFKKAYVSVRREVLYNILIEFGIPMKLARLIKMCLNETCSRIQIGKQFSDRFPIRNGLKQGDSLYRHFFVNFPLVYAIKRVQEL